MKNQNKILSAINGDTKFDLVIKDINFVNVITKETYRSEIGVVDGVIGHVNQPNDPPLAGVVEVNGEGKFAIPGLIDTHIHTESTMMTVSNMAKAIIPHGTTTIACDPHEIGNVFGIKGVEYILESGKETPLNVNVLAPSCIPAVDGLETAGAAFYKDDVEQLLALDGVEGLGEVMDYPGVISNNERMSGILNAAKENNVFIQGHAPSLVGRKLSAYLSQGVESCHETSFAEEARYKLRAGMTVECRESSIVKDIKTLAPVMKEFNYPETLTFCTDDREPDDLLNEGHVDHVIRTAIKEGIPAIEAIKIATYNAANLLRRNDIGSLSPGKRADIVLIDNLESFNVVDVYIAGEHVANQGKLLIELISKTYPIESINSVNLINGVSIDDFKIYTERDKVKVNTISYQEDVPIITKLKEIEFETKDGYVDLSGRDDVFTISVFERHGINGNKATGLMKDLGLKHGAIASTLSHDSHNLIVIGKNYDDMLLAVNKLQETGGGMVCVLDGKVEAILEFPIAGLISPESIETLAPKVKKFKETVEKFGIHSPSPIIQIASFSLPVIPFVRLTDRGLVDVNKQEFIPIIIE